VGGVGGSDRHTLTIEEMPSHTHPVPMRANNFNLGGGAAIASGNQGADITVLSNQTGGSQPHNNLPLAISRNLWIRFN